MIQPNATVSGHKFEQMQETSYNLQHLGIRMMHDLTERRNNVEQAYAKAIELGLEPGHVTNALPFSPSNHRMQKHKITTDVNTPHLPTNVHNDNKRTPPFFDYNHGQVSPHPKSPKLIKLNNTFSTFTEELDECANLYKLNVEQNDIVLNASRNVIKFNARLNEQIKSKPLLLPLKVSPIKRMQSLNRAQTSVGRGRYNNNGAIKLLQKYNSLPNLRRHARPNTTPAKSNKLFSKTTAETTVSSPKHSTILSRRSGTNNANSNDIKALLPQTTLRCSTTDISNVKSEMENEDIQLTWEERMAKRDLKKHIDDYTTRKRQWGKILKGELSSMNKIAIETISTRKRKWLTLLYILKPIYYWESPLFDDREERAAQRAMVEASIRMQSLFRGSFTRKAQSKLTKVQKLLLKRLWIVRLNLSTSKRKRAGKIVRKFCIDYASTSQFKTILKKYRWRVIFCQRTIRSFLACKHAKLKLLKKIWMKYELPIAKELQAKHVQMIKNSMRKQEEQRKTKNSFENRNRDAAIAKQKQKQIEKLLKASNKANDENKQKRSLELMLLIRRCKGLTKVLDAKKNGDMKANLNAAMINKMAKANEKNANMKLPYKLRLKYLERILRIERYKYIRRPIKKDEYQTLMMMQAKMMLDGNYNGMAEIQQAAEKTMQKPVFKFFKRMNRSEKYLQREVKKAFEELDSIKRKERRRGGNNNDT